jgi:hypothetical protein
LPLLRGAKPSPRHRLAAATPVRIVGPTPPQFLWKPVQLSMWLNATYGCCVTSEEAFAKACNNPEIFITDDTVLAWATANNVLNGADLTQVLDLMQNAGFAQDGNIYNDGPFNSVDWTNTTALQNAIAQGPVKIGVAADQLETAVGTSDPPVSGWVATGFTKDTNEDHCVSLCGYGTIAWLAAQLGVSVPDGIDGTQQGLGLFTWDSIGIIDWPSMLAITGEAWLRNPVTVVVKQ